MIERDPDSLPPDPGELPTLDGALVERDAARQTAGDAAALDVFAPGDLVADRYRVLAFLARGGMGAVYRVLDCELGVEVALKTIRSEIAADKRALRRFKQEVLLARSVSHPNVCRIFDLGLHRASSREVSFLTMEFLAGETLADRLRKRGRFHPDDILPLFRQLAAALDAAHGAGVVHRDLKTANVMLVPAPNSTADSIAAVERAVITDFGLATATQESNRRGGDAEDGFVVGTPAYMSPEQLRGERVGPSADLYALGVVLFELLTGQLPFRGDTPLEMAKARLTVDPPAIGDFVHAGARWSDAVERLLARAPEARFRSATDLLAALEGRVEAERSIRHSLPAERDAFVGRSREMSALADRIRDGASVITLVGPGGTGKTRLARHYAWSALTQWPGGVWFADLGEARDAAGIAFALAKSLDVSLSERDPVDDLGRRLKDLGRALVVLDSIERVLADGRAALERWRQQAGNVVFLATSQERLRLPDESVLEIAPLDPDREAIDLFAVRARAHRPDFAVLDSNRDTIAEISRLLDGLPLAIEMATARLRALSLEQLRDRLGDRFRLLRGSERGRHETLRATFDWSWDLLRPLEQAALAQATVFEGGFTLEAAEEVIDLTVWPEEPYVLDVVQALVDKSWLRAQASGDALRFSMYSSLQQYASEKLRNVGESGADALGEDAAPLAEIRHGARYARLGTSEATRSLTTHGATSRLRALRVELDNVTIACRRAVRRTDIDGAVATLAAAWTVLEMSGPHAVGVDLAREVLSIEGISGTQRARALRCLGAALASAGQFEEGCLHLEQALALHRESGNRRFEGILLAQLGVVRWHQGGTDDALRLYQEALAIHREVGNRAAEGVVQNNLGVTYATMGRSEEARQSYDAALAAHREVGDRRSEAIALANLGNAFSSFGRFGEAGACYEASLAICRDLEYRIHEGTVLALLGNLRVHEGRAVEARSMLSSAVAILRSAGERLTETTALSGLALLDAREGRAEDAGAALERGESLLHGLGLGRERSRLLYTRGEVDRLCGRLESAWNCLCEAETLANQVGESTNSLLGVQLSELRGRLEALR